MYTKNNPHLTILESAFALVKKHKDDKETLSLLADILWALEFDLKLDDYRYHYLAELCTGIGKEGADGNTKYIASIEAKIDELRQAQKPEA